MSCVSLWQSQVFHILAFFELHSQVLSPCDPSLSITESSGKSEICYFHKVFVTFVFVRVVRFWDMETFHLVSTTEDASSAVRRVLFLSGTAVDLLLALSLSLSLSLSLCLSLSLSLSPSVSFSPFPTCLFWNKMITVITENFVFVLCLYTSYIYCLHCRRNAHKTFFCWYLQIFMCYYFLVSILPNRVEPLINIRFFVHLAEEQSRYSFEVYLCCVQFLSERSICGVSAYQHTSWVEVWNFMITLMSESYVRTDVWHHTHGANINSAQKLANVSIGTCDEHGNFCWQTILHYLWVEQTLWKFLLMVKCLFLFANRCLLFHPEGQRLYSGYRDLLRVSVN